MADRWCPPGLGLPREIMVSHPSVELPIDELEFQLMRTTDAPRIGETARGIMNDCNLDMQRRKGYGGMFVALHLGYHYYNILLYFQYLEPESEPTHVSTTYAAECRRHGLVFSRLLHTARELGACHVVYLTVAHMTIVSSSVLLHLLLFGNDEWIVRFLLEHALPFESESADHTECPVAQNARRSPRYRSHGKCC
ncbi:hypothetical protein EK21DRAFT_87708 [Setomelanomma holmii]|uniref:Uncharacterized protein n=1 Tax=Setomelanomma holmii TaxID=210430 RepID=A0A9P4HD67_9PLEO|nr:hypothetical protein EK21DRAFT_87708 [Setomelanomma holmii]